MKTVAQNIIAVRSLQHFVCQPTHLKSKPSSIVDKIYICQSKQFLIRSNTQPQCQYPVSKCHCEHGCHPQLSGHWPLYFRTSLVCALVNCANHRFNYCLSYITFWQARGVILYIFEHTVLRALVPDMIVEVSEIIFSFAKREFFE